MNDYIYIYIYIYSKQLCSLSQELLNKDQDNSMMNEILLDSSSPQFTFTLSACSAPSQADIQVVNTLIFS